MYPVTAKAAWAGIWLAVSHTAPVMTTLLISSKDMWTVGMLATHLMQVDVSAKLPAQGASSLSVQPLQAVSKQLGMTRAQNETTPPACSGTGVAATSCMEIKTRWWHAGWTRSCCDHCIRSFCTCSGYRPAQVLTDFHFKTSFAWSEGDTVKY